MSICPVAGFVLGPHFSSIEALNTLTRENRLSHLVVIVVGMANAQLTLVPVDPDWKLDEETKRIGRAGLAQARAALAETSSPIVLSPTLVLDSDPQPATFESDTHDLLAA